MVLALAPSTPQEAIRLIQVRTSIQNEYHAYYHGYQPLTYTSRKYRDNFARMVSAYHENMAPAVISPMVDRLKILNVEINGNDSNDAATALWKLWKASRMEAQANYVHQDCLVVGNSYILVWPNKQGVPTITLQGSDEFAVHYVDESFEIDWAAKCWQQEDGFIRLTLYYADRIERYISDIAAKDTGNTWDKLRYALIGENAIVRNPYNKVPAFHFANKVPQGMYGLSELRDVKPIQDALNKSIADLLIGMEFSAFRQRWATGIELDDEDLGSATPKKPPFMPGQDRMLTTPNENAEFGEFSQTDLSQFIDVHDMFCLTLSRVTGTPLHYMQLNSSVYPSGEALKTAEERFVAKINDRQQSFGAIWEEVFSFMAQIARLNLTDSIDVKWQSAAPRSEREAAEVGGLKKVYGVSNKQIQRENGYTESQIVQIEKENEEALVINETVPNNTNNNQVDSVANQRLIKR